MMTTSTPEKQDGLKALNDAIAKIEETITSLGGVFKVKMTVIIMYSEVIQTLAMYTHTISVT